VDFGRNSRRIEESGVVAVSSIVTDIESIEQYMALLFPTATIYLQYVPSQPTANSLSIRFQGADTGTETAYHIARHREYQLVYFGTSNVDVLTKMDALDRKLNNDLVIPIKDSLRYMRVESFSLSQPFKTENGIDAIIGVLAVTVREARDQEQFEKIMNVYARYE
jgi:hypothetical protein